MKTFIGYPEEKYLVEILLEATQEWKKRERKK